MFKRHHILVTLLCMLMLTTSAYAQRGGRDGNNGGGLDQAVRQVEQQTGGQVLSAETRRSDSGVTYRIKVLTPNGKVRIINIRR